MLGVFNRTYIEYFPSISQRELFVASKYSPLSLSLAKLGINRPFVWLDGQRVPFFNKVQPRFDKHDESPLH